MDIDELKDKLIDEMNENNRRQAVIERLTAERDILQKDKNNWYAEKLHALTVNINLGVKIAELLAQIAEAKAEQDAGA